MSSNAEQSQQPDQVQQSQQAEQSKVPAVVEEITSTSADGTKSDRPFWMKQRPDGICENPGCNKIVPGGLVPNSVKHYFCSESCQEQEYWLRSRHIIGTCEQCGGPIIDKLSRKGVARFCSKACDIKFDNERMFEGTGPFRSVIEEHLAETDYAAPGGVKGSLTRFFTYVFTKEKIGKLEDIGPKVVSRYLAAEKARGITNSNDVTHLSALFSRLMYEESFDRRNPVIPRIHAAHKHPRTRQPYEESEMLILWRIVEASGITQLKVMFAIGEESGLRNSEVCNIRLSDVDLVKQTIYVRLPTKNGEPRTVPFHKKVKKYLEQWLQERDPRCQHDHLLHNSRLTPFTNTILDRSFGRLYSGMPQPAASFEFHRLRHTWATRLVNAGMRLPVLQPLGGWKFRFTRR
jgi:integrase